ncbi:NAD(P)-binding protein [Hymenopellis radicata]|nr:NAD(P)-binding protein [Hymenopellis radicata]
MSPSTKVYLITGANRGIGLAMLNEIASNNADKDVAIIAAARDISSQAIADISRKYPGKIHALKYIAGDVENNKVLAQDIEAKFGHVDTVVAVAGISNYLGTVLETPVDQFRDHFEVNAVGVAVLFQALYNLLKSSKEPNFTAFIQMPAGMACYGASKAALNYIVRRIHFENEWLICFPLAPGIVDTDMSRLNRSLDKTGSLAQIQDAMSIPGETAARMLVGIVEDATREKDGGEFVNIDGTKIPW